VLNPKTENKDGDGTCLGKLLQNRVQNQNRPSRNAASRALMALLDESGQVLPWTVFLMVLFLGISALVVDVGHGMVVQRQLQASTDAAALAAAQTLPKSTYAAVALSYSAAAGSSNAYGGVSVGTPTVTPLCLTTVSNWGITCTSTSPNAVQVSETATIPTYFAGILGMKTLTVNAISTASRGARPQPFNVAFILDTTPSMNTWDSNCGATQLQCATAAIQVLMQGLAPTLDTISMFTFPNIPSETSQAYSGYTCGQSLTAGPYTFPSSTASSLSTMPFTTTTTTGSGWNQKTTTTTIQETYQVTGFLTDYRTSDTATSLNNNSMLSNAVGLSGSGGCQGIQTGYENTYYAGAIYAAEAALEAKQQAQQAAGQQTMNAIILLSDGNATAKENNPGGSFSPGSDDMVTGSQSTTIATNGGVYPSWVGECSQGVDAASTASNNIGSNGKADGTIVFTIAYGSLTQSNSSNCGSDRTNGVSHQNITPCQAMQQMSTGWSAGDTSHFYSDYYAPGGDSGCQASGANNTVTSLSNIVSSIVGALSGTRLIPNNTP